MSGVRPPGGGGGEFLGTNEGVQGGERASRRLIRRTTSDREGARR